MRYTSNGLPVVTLRLAINDREEPEFFDCVAWRQAAEFAGQYLRKGRLVLVEGRLHARNWQAHDGTARRIVEVVADTLQAVSPKPADEATEGAIETAVATAG
jgi:single-strand DNA-binding protein